MPIKDPLKRKEYQRELMRKRRQGLTNVSPLFNKDEDKNVSPTKLDPNKFVSPVSPKTKMLDPGLTVRPENKLDLVRPLDPPVSPENNNSCSLNHYSFAQLFKEVSEQVEKDYQQLYQQHPQTARSCFDCRNRQRNYQIMRKLLNDYYRKCKYENK